MKNKLFTFLIFAMYSLTAQEVNIVQQDCKLTDEQLNLVQSAFDYELDFYSQIFDLKALKPATILLIGNLEKFKNTRYALTGKRKTNGVYSTRTNTILVNQTQKKHINVMFHEINHYILRGLIDTSFPKWINEGTSEYFETFEKKDGKFNFPMQANKIEKIKSWFKAKKKVKTFLAMDNKTWMGFNKREFLGSKDMGYAMGYAVVFYLINENKPFYDTIMKELNNRGKSVKIIAKKYPGGVKAFEKDISSYYLNFDDSLVSKSENELDYSEKH